MTDREKLRAEAAELFPRWTNLAHYVVSGHEVADAMAWARDTDPPAQALIAALDELEAANQRQADLAELARLGNRALTIYDAATRSRIRQPEWLA